MGELVILNQLGDEPITWDPDDKASVAAAYKQFQKLKKDGYQFYEVKESRGAPVRRFNKKAGRLIAAPGARSTADKEKGRRPAAMAGGPVASGQRSR